MNFSFGKNWQSYSQNALNSERINQARQAFQNLLGNINLRGKKFIDIGFGQGLSLITAAEMGADVLGIEIDKDNLEALKLTQKAMGYRGSTPKTQIVSILDESFVEKEKKKGGYNVVHSWGVLHHTGNMRQAIRNSCVLVADDGYFICSIYNGHWSSPIWIYVKWVYNKLPKVFQRLLIMFFYPIIYIAKWLVTRENPKKKERGMDFFHSVVDWIGGYPYEYATTAEIEKLVCQNGFQSLLIRPAKIPTGCNEFVFKKKISNKVIL